jgi:hypothetical protein
MYTKLNIYIIYSNVFDVQPFDIYAHLLHLN